VNEPRDLSGIFFRTQVDGRWVNRTFEDLTEAEQDRQMKDRSEEWLRSLAKQLAASLRRIGDQFDIMNGDPS